MIAVWSFTTKLVANLTLRPIFSTSIVSTTLISSLITFSTMVTLILVIIALILIIIPLILIVVLILLLDRVLTFEVDCFEQCLLVELVQTVELEVWNPILQQH